MNRWLLLRSMTKMELRTTLRERHQLAGLAVSILALVLALSVPAYKAVQGVRHERAAQGTAMQQAIIPPAAVMAMRWALIGAGAGIGLFFTLGYLMSAALASFVGEKEGRTLEILLAAPIPDTTLFLTKCISVLLPSAMLGYVLVAVPTLVACYLAADVLAMLPIHVPLHVLVLSVPPLLLLQAALVGLTAAVSAKAETVRGAGQIVGVVFVLPVFGLSYGLPLLLQVPAIGAVAKEWAKAWLQMPFPVQYGLSLLVLAVPAALFVALGRALFRRDRLLV